MDCVVPPMNRLKKIQYLFEEQHAPGKFEIITRGKQYKKSEDPRNRYAIEFLRYTLPASESPKKRFSCSIFINHLAPVFGARLIQKYCDLDKRVSIMINFVLFWAKSRGILTPRNGYLSSYAICLMIIFFLQLQNPPVLPSIQLFCKENSVSEKKIQIPDFINFVRNQPTKKDEKYHFYKEDIIKTDVNFNFNFVDCEQIKKTLGLPKNNESPAILISKFFYYFAVDYPVFFECEKLFKRKE